MATPRLPYRMVSDRQRSGISYWRVYFPDSSTSRERKVSTGIVDNGTKTSRVLAERKALELLDEFRRKPRGRSAPFTLAEFGADFWDWDKSGYLLALTARDKKALSPEYARNMAQNFAKHVVPRIGSLTLEEITPDVLDDLVTDLLVNSNLSTQTAKHVICTLSPMLENARKKQIIKYNPIPLMLKFAVRPKRNRDAFTPDEAMALLNPATIESVWGAKKGMSRKRTQSEFCFHPNFNAHRNYAINLLVATTGARIGTVLALAREDIRLESTNGQEYFVVSLIKSIVEIQGVKKGTKTGDGTTVPVAKEVLEPLLDRLPAKGFLFPSGGRHGVISQKTVLRSLKLALTRIGINDEAQSLRALGLHSWRHTWETRASASRLSDVVRASFTEHSDGRTSKRYRHLLPSDLLAVLPIQRGLVQAAQETAGPNQPSEQAELIDSPST